MTNFIFGILGNVTLGRVALVAATSVPWNTWFSLVILEYKHPRSHSRFATFMHFHLPLFSVLTKDNSKCFWVSNGIKSLVSILCSHAGLDLHFSHSLILNLICFFLSPFSILRIKHSFLTVVSFYPPFILCSQHNVIFCPCCSLFWCLALFLFDFIVFDSQFWLHQHLLLFLFSVPSVNIVSHAAKLFSFSLFSILMIDFESLDAILHSHVQCSFS